MFSKANRRESTDAMACSSRDTLRDPQDGSCQVDIADIHHQYFTVATSFLKDIIAESAKVGTVTACYFGIGYKIIRRPWSIGVLAAWPHGEFAQLQMKQSVFQPWLGTLCCVLGQRHFNLLRTLTVPPSTQVYK